MTDQNTPIEEEGARVTSHLYPEDSPQKALRQIGLGIQPLILLEVDFDEETNDYVYEITSSLLDSQAEVLDMLEVFVMVLKGALEQERESEEADRG